ncbi:MAG: DUF11 domain-containing protein [Saprospiraceae bacterium]|nr:DUF11 domain-containing protein [Saprospiraceae bacterium]
MEQHLGPFDPGDQVTFTIEVINQGTLDATDIQINDYIPDGFDLADTDWTEVSPGVAQLNTPIASLAKGMFTTVDITFVIEPGFYEYPHNQLCGNWRCYKCTWFARY